jgi:hypothetical protein
MHEQVSQHVVFPAVSAAIFFWLVIVFSSFSTAPLALSKGLTYFDQKPYSSSFRYGYASGRNERRGSTWRRMPHRQRGPEDTRENVK